MDNQHDGQSQREVSAESLYDNNFPQEVTDPDHDVRDRSRSSGQLNFELQTIEEMQIMADRIEGLIRRLNEIQSKIDKIHESRSKPTGCGFSCSNNSLNL